ncbi:unnamed protein product [Adineta steineri]|uniref:Uncharacterized protein n=1 Tax=Adineta steineri TaxID=433720 RepID=A0A819CSW3_9BILA|nr:unnamed protein product [Adineta steineri]
MDISQTISISSQEMVIMLNEVGSKLDEYSKQLDDMKEELLRSMIPKGIFHEFPAKTFRKLTVFGRNPIGKCQEFGLGIGLGHRIRSTGSNSPSMKSPEYHGTDRFRAGLFDLGGRYLFCNENTTNQDIEDAIKKCFSDVSSLFHIKITQSLKLLQLLAEELKEPLFI